MHLPHFQDPDDTDAEGSFRHLSLMPRLQNEKEHGSLPDTFAKSQFTSIIQLICTSILILSVALLRNTRTMALFLDWSELKLWLLSSLGTKISRNVFRFPFPIGLGDLLGGSFRKTEFTH